MSLTDSPHQNHLLAALPEADYERLLPDLELIPMLMGRTLYEPGDQMNYVYFPTTSIVSLIYVSKSGATPEIAITGNDGLVGISLFLSGGSAPRRVMVHVAGNGYRIKANIVTREFALGGNLQHLVLRYTQVLITQMAMSAVCNRYHTLEQQLCRLFLLNLDRSHGNELLLTQEFIANMLGVRRVSVTEVARNMQADGLIKYSRGHIEIPDRTKLEKRVCECYSVLKREYDYLLPYKISGMRGNLPNSH